MEGGQGPDPEDGPLRPPLSLPPRPWARPLRRRGPHRLDAHPWVQSILLPRSPPRGFCSGSGEGPGHGGGALNALGLALTWACRWTLGLGPLGGAGQPEGLQEPRGTGLPFLLLPCCLESTGLPLPRGARSPRQVHRGRPPLLSGRTPPPEAGSPGHCSSPLPVPLPRRAPLPASLDDVICTNIS